MSKDIAYDEKGIYTGEVIDCNGNKRTECQIFTRVMGYHRPVSQYNRGKKSEYYSRSCFNEQASTNSEFIKEFV